jgi:hypothetical protein
MNGKEQIGLLAMTAWFFVTWVIVIFGFPSDTDMLSGIAFIVIFLTGCLGIKKIGKYLPDA